jgi:SAM-dependent methyltransferase
MNENLKSIEDMIRNGDLIFAVLSNIRKGAQKTYNKLDIKPVLIKGSQLYHVTYQYEKKVLHDNFEATELIDLLDEVMGNYFKQGVFYATDGDYQLLFNKKMEGKIITKPPSRFKVEQEHNRKKNYIIPDGEPCDFMTHLGLMDSDGRVFKKKYDKFRQLNKYLEFVSDSMGRLEDLDVIRIIDFGCGKAYLTFALYYYLVKLQNLNVEIVGLDLKEDVIRFCNDTASALGYDGLAFELGDIKDYETEKTVDMVVSLHACDTATDEALIKSVGWDAKIIFAVPCCQHELFKQLENPAMNPLLRYGVIKDKLATLVTDSLRASALECVGYDVQMLEFIDMEHTPKNVLIRAYKADKTEEAIMRAQKEYQLLKATFKAKPSIDRLLMMK